MVTKIIKAWIDGAIQNIEVEDIEVPEMEPSVEERVETLEGKHEVVFTDGNLLVGNGTDELEEMTPEEVLSHINGASVAVMTTAEYEALDEDKANANTLYVLTDSDDENSSSAIMQEDLLDTVSNHETVAIECASTAKHDLIVSLSSATITDFSSITVTLTSENGEQSVMANEDGTVVGLFSESTFTLTLSSDVENFDASEVLITCTYQIDLNKVLNDYVLHVSLDGEDDGTGGTSGGAEGSGGAGSAIVDETLSISGAAADAKATGDAIAAVFNLVGNKPVSEQISDALADFDGGGVLNIEDDGDGNVTITTIGSISITDDGNGNVTIA